MNLSRLVVVAVLGVSALVASDKISSHFLLSGVEKNAVTTALFVPIVLLWLYLTYRHQFASSGLFNHAAPFTWAWRLVGLSFLIGGMFLFLGNRSGAFATFPMAGSICLVTGALIIVFFGRNKT